MEAAEAGSLAVLRHLLDYGADTEILDSRLLNALSYATWKNHLQAARALVAAGASLRAPPGGWTPLYRSAIAGGPDMVSLFLDAGDDVHWADTFGVTPLFIAAANGNVDTIRLLLAAGAEIDHRANDGTTALMSAVRHKRSAAARELLESGADPSIVDDAGSCALGLASANDDREVLELLRAADAEECPTDLR
jgi:uncharacterized protein